MKKLSLTKQLLYICILIIGIIFITLGIILPNELLPIYEENIYNKLKQPLSFIRTSDDVSNNNNDTDIAYIYQNSEVILVSKNLVNDIKILKRKIKNIDNENFNLALNHEFEDEIYSLNESIEAMHEYLLNNESYKKQLYQNISHDFKTPIAVIKSYIEAAEDGIETNEDALKVIKEQTDKLENKVHSLLYLNKLNYLKEQENQLKARTNLAEVVATSVEKFKLIRPELTYKLDIDDKEMYRGTYDMWETIIDNLLNNFMRYAKKEIKITIKNQKIVLFNDGENIDKNIIDNIFTPYKKGLNGMFGLGLSIVKKTLELLNYSITVDNVKNGVNFIIK